MRLVISLLVLLITGCASKPAPSFGVFSAPAGHHIDTIVEDSSAQISALFSPATTQFRLQHAFAGQFGSEFLEDIRHDGFAVFAPATDSPEVGPEQTDKTLVPPQINTLPLSYILDQPAPGLYRISLLVGEKTLSRAYAQLENDFIAAGSWVFRE